MPSSNPDSPHQSFDGCSFDSDGKVLVYNPNPTPTRRTFATIIDRHVTMVVYRLLKNSENFGQNVNGKTILARSTGKFSKWNVLKGSPKFSSGKCPYHAICNSSPPSWNYDQVKVVLQSWTKVLGTLM